NDRSMHIYRISTKNGVFEAHARTAVLQKGLEGKVDVDVVGPVTGAEGVSYLNTERLASRHGHMNPMASPAISPLDFRPPTPPASKPLSQTVLSSRSGPLLSLTPPSVAPSWYWIRASKSRIMEDVGTGTGAGRRNSVGSPQRNGRKHLTTPFKCFGPTLTLTILSDQQAGLAHLTKVLQKTDKDLDVDVILATPSRAEDVGAFADSHSHSWGSASTLRASAL
ncbi:hypothetical protein H0H92_006405, partial [Tricholoma furcatifolium]